MIKRINFQSVGEMPVEMGTFKLKSSDISCDSTPSPKAPEETTAREKYLALSFGFLPPVLKTCP